MTGKILNRKKLKKLINVFLSLAMVFSFMQMNSMKVNSAEGTYCQITGTNGQTRTPVYSKITSAIVSNASIQFIEINGVECATPINVNGYTDSSQNITSALLKITDGFRYADNKLYDIYIKLTNIVGSSNWTASVGSYISFKPSSSSGTAGYDYEIWLIKSGEANIIENRASFLFVGGSCYMAGENHTNTEYCKPWGSDGNIYVSYTTNPGTGVKYNSNLNAWTPANTDDAYNESDTVIYGRGTSENHSIKGGYTVTAQNGGWGSEMVFGYVVNDKTITYTNGSESGIASNIPEGQIANKIPASLQKEGKHITGWTANINLSLNDGTTITAGSTISTQQLSKIIDYSTFTLTVLGYENHNIVTDEAITPTCTTAGRTEGSHCSICNEVFVAQTEVPAFGGHDWRYTANSPALTASCSRKETCNQEDVSLTIIASSPTYSGVGVTPGWKTGQTISFTLDGQTQWEATIGASSTPAIYYEGTGSTTYEKSTTKPTQAGTYKATITKDEATASLNFVIKQVYQVSFNANGGYGTMSSIEVFPGNFTLPLCTIKPPVNKEFEGWALTASGSKISTLTTYVSGNTMLYAKWKNHTHQITTTVLSGGIKKESCGCGFYIINFD